MLNNSQIKVDPVNVVLKEREEEENGLFYRSWSRTKTKDGHGKPDREVPFPSPDTTPTPTSATASPLSTSSPQSPASSSVSSGTTKSQEQVETPSSESNSDSTASASIISNQTVIKTTLTPNNTLRKSPRPKGFSSNKESSKDSSRSGHEAKNGDHHRPQLSSSAIQGSDESLLSRSPDSEDTLKTDDQKKEEKDNGQSKAPGITVRPTAESVTPEKLEETLVDEPIPEPAPTPENQVDHQISFAELEHEIKTTSIERRILSLLSQISTLVNTREKPIKTEKQLRAISRVGQAVNLAVERFAAVGEAMADDNPEIREEMYDACKDARVAGTMIEQMCDISTDLEPSQLQSYADRSAMVRAARALVPTVTRILLLADSVVVKQILTAKDRISISLNRLENVANFTEFVKAFSQFGTEMVELAHLTGDRQNDLKSERRRAQMGCARQILERSTMILLTSSKACLRHPDCDAARENREAVFTQMRRAMNLIHFVVKDGVLPELAASSLVGLDHSGHYSRRTHHHAHHPLHHHHRQGNYSLYHSGLTARGISSSLASSPSSSLPAPTPTCADWKVLDYDQCLTAYNAIRRFEDLIEMSRITLCGGAYRERLQSAFDELVERTQDFTDSAYTSHEHREKILLLCDGAKLELNQLLRIGVCLDEAGSNTPTEDFEASIVQTVRASNELKHQLQITALDQAEKLFTIQSELESVNRLKNSAISGDHQRLEELAEFFAEHSDHVQEVCKLLHHVATSETLQIKSKITESSLSVYGPQFLNACHLLCIYPTSKISKENLEVFLDIWIALYTDVLYISKETNELLSATEIYTSPASLCFPRQSRPPKSVTIQEDHCSHQHGQTIHETSQDAAERSRLGQVPHSAAKGSKPLDSEEQAKIAKAGLTMKEAASEVDAETNKWPDSEDNDIVRKAKAMSQLAFSMYQFTRGEGELKTTQDLFTQAEFFAEEANKFYKVVRHFSYQVPSGPLKKELLEHLDKVPTFVQQLQFTVKNSTVGKAATFTKVDNVIQETKNLMTFVSKTVNSCLECSSKYNLDMGAVRARSRTLSPSGRYDEDGYDGSGMGSKGGTASSDPNI